MPALVTLAKWTDEGIRTIKDSPKRPQAFEDRITAREGDDAGREEMDKIVGSLS